MSRLNSAAEATLPRTTTTKQHLGAAVHRNRLLSRAGIQERMFTAAFSKLVYPQIWEDPVVDMAAMQLEAGHHVVAISSGGCNALSYLTAAPIRITVLDINSAQAALVRLKLAAIRHLPGYDEFYDLFGRASSRENVRVYDAQIAPRLDAVTRAYWNGRDALGRRRIEAFARGFYRTGVLGRFIAAGHATARMLGADPSAIVTARSLAEQREIYERELKPLFRKPIVRALFRQRSSLFGLGIPPAQYDALAEGRPMDEVVEERLARLACGFDLSTNYFAWQAFNRGYAQKSGPLPPYLEPAAFPVLRERIANASVVDNAFSRHLATCANETVDRYVLLDAQDWMNDAELVALWTEITRTARPGARVIFRTAGTRSILPGRLPDALLGAWDYRAEESAEHSRADRSAIYGAFHLYVKRG